MVSLHDRQARPIATGRLGRPVEFGYKGQVVDNDDGVVLDHDVQAPNPPDAHAVGARRRAGQGPNRAGTEDGDRTAGTEKPRSTRQCPTLVSGMW